MLDAIWGIWGAQAASLFFAAACREASAHTNLSACWSEFYSTPSALPSLSARFLRYSGGLE